MLEPRTDQGTEFLRRSVSATIISISGKLCPARDGGAVGGAFGEIVFTPIDPTPALFYRTKQTLVYPSVNSSQSRVSTRGA
jgi:hypothetical protein